jgi:hypothetical protein
MPAPAPPPRVAWRLVDWQAGAPEEPALVCDAAELEPAAEVEEPEDAEEPEDVEEPDVVEEPDDPEAALPLVLAEAGEEAADDPEDAAQPAAARTLAASSGMASSFFFMGTPVAYRWFTNVTYDATALSAVGPIFELLARPPRPHPAPAPPSPPPPSP